MASSSEPVLEEQCVTWAQRVAPAWAEPCERAEALVEEPSSARAVAASLALGTLGSHRRVVLGRGELSVMELSTVGSGTSAFPRPPAPAREAQCESRTVAALPELVAE